MDLQQTINHLEQQAAKYTEAANTLRSLLPGQSGGAASTATTPDAANQPNQPKRRGRQPGSTNKPKAAKADKPKRFVSQETRDKIAKATKARHEAARIAREGAVSNNDGENNNA